MRGRLQNNNQRLNNPQTYKSTNIKNIPNSKEKLNSYGLQNIIPYDKQKSQDTVYKYPYRKEPINQPKKQIGKQKKITQPSTITKFEGNKINNYTDSQNQSKFMYKSKLQRIPEHPNNLATPKNYVSRFQTIKKEGQSQKTAFYKHQRYNSEPSQTVSKQKRYSSINSKGEKVVNFKNNNLVTNLNSVQKKQRQSLQKSRSPSILKNAKAKKIVRSGSVPYIYSPRKFNNSQDQIGSVISIEMSQEMNTKQQKLNVIIKNKYKGLLKNLTLKSSIERQNSLMPQTQQKNSSEQKQFQIKQRQKYTDTLFPPTYSSIFGMLNQSQKQMVKSEAIKWLRISEVFPNYKLVLFNEDTDQKSSIKIIHQNFITKFCSQQLAAVFNGIKNCRQLHTKIFQQQKFNQFGIYCLKIFQQNIWKYVIIDDKIPVIEKSSIKSKVNAKQLTSLNPGSKYVPLFLNILPEKSSSSSDKDEYIQIWPLLLQKAYASYYSCYENFHSGKELDYIEEMTGSPTNQFSFINKDDSKLKNTIKMIKQQLMSNHNSMALGWVEPDFPNVPICNNSFKNSKQKTSKSSILYFDPLNNFTETNCSYEKMPNLFNKIYTLTFNKFKHCFNSLIGLYQQKGLKTSPKSTRSEISVRYFRIKNASQYCISIRQKEKRFYQNSSFNYEYMWVRVILILKEINGYYRWISGKYSNQKSINIQSFLEGGQYYMIVMPQWRATHCHQISMLLYSNYPQIQIDKKSYQESERIIEKTCMDLAQRQGKLSQLNAFICTYNYVNQDVGLIIENINNERTIGAVKVLRSINGLQAKVQIVPVNQQFYNFGQNQKYKTKKKFKNNITINIPQDQSYTVVLRMKGGIDSEFFKVFDFGH